MLVDSTNDEQIITIDANPSIYTFLSGLNLSQDVKRRLSLNLKLIENGVNENYKTPIGKDYSVKELTEGVDSIISSNSTKLIKELVDFETSNRSKIGPRSIAKPWKDRVSNVRSYFETPSIEPFVSLESPSLGYPPRLRPLSFGEASNYLKSNTNSGLPYFVKKGKVKDKTLVNFKEIYNEDYPCVLFTRSQELGKTRDVWGFPMDKTINEMRYYRPLLNLQSKQSWRSALLGPDYVDKSISKMFRESSGLKFLSIDFSAYDASVKTLRQRRCFDYVKSCFQSDYHSEIDSVFETFNTIGLLTPSGIFTGSHGIPSGSTFTNEVGSINQFDIAINSGCNIKHFQIQGDDGVYLIKDEDIKTLMSSFRKSGLVVNDDKSYISSNTCIYLQRLYNSYYSNNGFIGGIYSIYRALNRIIHQERYSNFEDYGLSGKDYYSIRTLSILENCKYHPLFEEFVKYIYSLDKYLLSFTRESVDKFSLMQSMGSGRGGNVNNQFGDDVSGIYNFSSYKIINSLH